MAEAAARSDQPEEIDLAQGLREWATRATQEYMAQPPPGRSKASIHEELRTTIHFLEHRFMARLARFDRRARHFGNLHTFGNVIVISGGLLTSGTIAIGDPSKGWVQAFLIVVGLLIGVLTAINQIVRPGARSTSYALAAVALRQEAWDLLNRMARYETAESDYERTRRFLSEISEINRRADTPPAQIADLEPERSAQPGGQSS